MKKNFTVIAAGGLGTRLKNYKNNEYTKVLIPIGLTSMISQQIKQLKNWGYDNIVIVTNPDYDKLIKEDVKGNFPNENIEFVIQSAQLGIAHALKQAEPVIDKGSQISFILGDNFFGVNPFANNKSIYSDNSAALVLKKVNNPEDFGVAVLKNSKIVDLIEKPKKFISKYAVLGFYKYEYECFEIIDSLKKSDRGEYEITDLNKKYLNLSKVNYSIFDSWWIDAGTPERIEELSQKLI